MMQFQGNHEKLEEVTVSQNNLLKASKKETYKEELKMDNGLHVYGGRL